MSTLLRACLCSLLLLPLGAHCEFELVEAAPGIFVHRGAHHDSTTGIANVGAIVGEKCAAVIDTGGSLSEGEKLKQAIRAKTQVPVCYVINTHVHPDHIFGNAAFRNVEFIGHAKLPAAMAARGQTYLNATKRDLGEAAAGTEIVPPTRLVSDKLDLDLGGRTLRLTAWPTAHTDHDLTVFDERTQTLWLSDLLFVERVPVVDGSVKGWLDVIEKIRGIPAQLVVPGHGWAQGDWRGALAKQEAYLQELVRQARAAIKRGDTIQQAVKTLGQSARQDWLLFDSNHPRNVTTVYAELEWE